MVEPTNIQQPSLTFDELRLASLIANENKMTPVSVGMLAAVDLEVYSNESATLSSAIVDMVIQLDRIAASMGIDLSAAIRARFEPH